MKSLYQADSTEQELPEPAVAIALLRSNNRQWSDQIHAMFTEHTSQFPELAELNQRCEQAFVLATARLALRHGSWGDDFHPYHNERHVQELIDQGTAPILAQAGWNALPATHWLLLWLFAACHDLRQREEESEINQLIGANEAGSIAESWRVLDAAGFDRQADVWFYQTLRLTIAASTFGDNGNNASQVIESLAADQEQAELTLLAADIDTANVAAPMSQLARAAVRLVKEAEFRANRHRLGRSSAAPVLEFLTATQERYFFQQQRFQSLIGRKVFGPRKQRNQRAVQTICASLAQAYPDGLGGVTGGAVVDEFLARAAKFE